MPANDGSLSQVLMQQASLPAAAALAIESAINDNSPGALKNSIVVVSDSTGLDGFSTNGTQSFFNDNIAWWAAAYSKGSLTVDTSCSVGGWTTADVDLYFQQRVLSIKPRFVDLAIGLNNIFGASDATVVQTDLALRAWTDAAANKIIAYGGVPVISTLMPVGSTYVFSSTIKRKQYFEHNKWRRQYALSRGLPLLDVESLVIDRTSANADPYAAYFQPGGSPHPGKEIIRTIGARLWALVSPMVPASSFGYQSNQFTGNRIFSNPAFTGTSGNLNGGAGTLPDNVWGWDSGSVAGEGTTYSIVASTDSKLDFSGAPVKSPWITVTTDVSQLATAPNGTPASSKRPGLLFFSSGMNFSAGDVIYATAEVEIVTPNTIIGFSAALQDNTGTYGFTCPNQGSAFTPTVNADNSKNHILTPTVFNLPVFPVTIRTDLSNAGMWLMVQPTYSGVAGASGNAVWRVRNVDVWKAA